MIITREGRRSYPCKTYREARHRNYRQQPPYHQTRYNPDKPPNANGCPRPEPSHDPHPNTSGNAS